MRTLVTFRSGAFDLDCAPAQCGEDLARWMLDRFREEGAAGDVEPLQEDFGWIVTFDAEGTAHWAIVGYRPPDERGEGGDWVCWVEKKRGLLKALVGRRARAPHESAVLLMDKVLSGASEIRDVRWHAEADFEIGREDDWQTHP